MAKNKSLPQAIKESVKHKRPKDGLTAAQRKAKKMWCWMDTDPEYKKIYDQLGDVDKRKIRCYDSVKRDRDILRRALEKIIDRVHSAHNNKFDDFHVARILEVVGEILPAIDFKNSDTPVINPDRISHMTVRRHDYNFKVDRSKIKKLTKEQIVKMFVTFFAEYSFGHKYPGSDLGVYADVASAMVARALESVGVDSTNPNAIVEFLTEGPDAFAL